jgi:hypothetical protein
MTYFEKRMKVVKESKQPQGAPNVGSFVYVCFDSWAWNCPANDIGYTWLSGSYAGPDGVIEGECLEEVAAAPGAAPTVAEVAPHPFLVAPAPAPTPVEPVWQDPMPIQGAPVLPVPDPRPLPPVQPISGLIGPAGAAGPDVEAPDYKGHDNLAEMISGHIRACLDGLNALKTIAQAGMSEDSASYWEHEIKAWKDIQAAAKAEREGVNPKLKNMDYTLHLEKRVKELEAELIQEGHKKDQIIKNLTEQNNALTKQNVDALDAAHYRRAVVQYVNSAKIQLDAALCVLKPIE